MNDQDLLGGACRYTNENAALLRALRSQLAVVKQDLSLAKARKLALRTAVGIDKQMQPTYHRARVRVRTLWAYQRMLRALLHDATVAYNGRLIRAALKNVTSPTE